MIIVALTDIHGRIERLGDLAEALAEADVVLLTGDLTHFGGRADAARAVEAVRKHTAQVLAVAGNCDHQDVAAYLAEEGISLDCRHVVIDGVAFLGVGGSLPCPGRTPNEFSEDELAAFLQEAAEGLPRDLPWVLVSHQPPDDTAVDRVHSGAHVGSRSVRRFIEDFQPLVCFTGHIHEAAGTDTIGRTKIVNPGPVHMGGYACAEVTDRLVEVELRGRT
ncbi:MAG: metallophosphoesterase [Planctomycetota bacterium]|jgi:Icc-related predicted phosphoesterase